MAPILARSDFTWLSRVRVPEASDQPHTSPMSCSRERTAPGVDGERGEEVELERGEVDLGAVDGDPAGGAVDLERADAAGRGRRRGELGGALDPAEQGVGAGDDLAHPERLGDVVVGADAEPDEDVGLVVAGGEHEDRDRADRLDAAAHLEPVEAGQHDVEDDEVGARAR